MNEILPKDKADCSHEWCAVYEEDFLGLVWKKGYRCRFCKVLVLSKDLTPAGLPGVVIADRVLEGPGRCSDGTTYEEQIVHADGTVEIIR